MVTGARVGGGAPPPRDADQILGLGPGRNWGPAHSAQRLPDFVATCIAGFPSTAGVGVTEVKPDRACGFQHASDFAENAHQVDDVLFRSRVEAQAAEPGTAAPTSVVTPGMGAVAVTTPDRFWDAVVAESPVRWRGHTGVDTFGWELPQHRLSVSQVEDERTAHDRASFVDRPATARG